MDANDLLRRKLLVGGAGAVAAAGLGSLAQSAMAADEKQPTTAQASQSTNKYAIATLDLKWTRDKEFRDVFNSLVPMLDKRGARYIRGWFAAIGQYRKIVGIWEGSSYETLLAAFADPALQKQREQLEDLGSVTVDFASLLVAGPQKIDPAARPKGVVFTGTVTIRPGKADGFRAILVDALPTMASHGVLLEASYHTEIGNRDRILDVWWAPSANACYSALSDPVLDAPAETLDYSEVMASELVEINKELFVG